MNTKNITWGWFQGGFKPIKITLGGKADCGPTHNNIANESVKDYSAHQSTVKDYNTQISI